MNARGRILGVLALATAESGRVYGEAELAVAEDLGRRAAVAVDNARLYHEAEARGEAARALEYVADGVLLVDSGGVVRHWNPAAEAITGVAARDVLGRPATEAMPGWAAVAGRVPVAEDPATPARPETLPLELPGGERWLSISAVGFGEGTVYAFRDLTEERALERLRSDFVSTVSHELRTPLAAIYGAALTLRRPDVVLPEVQREGLLDVIAGESDRLARTVNDILWASRLDSGSMQVAIERCDARELAETVLQAFRAHVPTAVELAVEDSPDVPAVAADPDKVRQVLANLVDNAVKYSPDGGRVEIALSSAGSHVCFAVRDHGLGIPARSSGASSTSSTASTPTSPAASAAPASASTSAASSCAAWTAASGSSPAKARARPSRSSCRPPEPGSLLYAFRSRPSSAADRDGRTRVSGRAMGSADDLEYRSRARGSGNRACRATFRVRDSSGGFERCPTPGFVKVKVRRKCNNASTGVREGQCGRVPRTLRAAGTLGNEQSRPLGRLCEAKTRRAARKPPFSRVLRTLFGLVRRPGAVVHVRRAPAVRQ